MMRRTLAFLAVMILVLGLAACGSGKTPETSAPTTVPTTVTEPTTEPTTVPTTAPTEPQPAAVVGGIDLYGMSLEEAAAAMNESAAAYKLSLTVNGKKLTVSAEELGLKLDEAALSAFLQAAAEGAELPEAIFTYDRTALKNLLGGKLNVPATNATISYNSSKKQFTATEGTDGTLYDLDAAADAAAAALGMLNAQAEVEVSTSKITPELTAGSEKVKKALNTANGYLKTNVTYTFTPDGGETAKETVGAATLAKFVSVSDSMEVSVSKSAIESWASDMSGRHSSGDTKGSFVTTGGDTVGLTVTYEGQKVNKSALADDLYKCVTEGLSGTRTAPYKAKSSKPYGGSYVEVSLTAQKLWLYKNGEQVLSTNLVSGSVAEGHRTPTGVYSIYSKQTDRYLTGADYRSFVHYWMPFLGGYGLHDASWRSSFGGTIYYYDGSHGCVNLPSSAAKKIYNNVSVGTKVILYGGKTEVPDLEQKLSGTTSYTVAADAAPFKLDVKAKYTGDKLNISYSSSDTNVVTVYSNGTVTVKGVGTATITVKAAEFDFYTAAELKVTITVKEAAATEPTDPSEPKPTDPQPTEPKPTDPQPTDPEPTDPQPTDPKPTDPQPTEPEPTEPQPTEPKPTEPAPTEPAPTEPAPTESETEPTE